MSEIEFGDYARMYANGQVSRRRFVRRIVAGGATFAAANALVGALGVSRASAASGALYGTPPGQGGTPPGQGGTPPPLVENPPGLGGTPPGKGGTPPGQHKKMFS